MAKKDFYSILNVDHKANLKTIKSAYRQLALKYHPDHNPNNPEALKQFNLIREAYELLIDTNLRKQYDQTYKPPQSSTAKREPNRAQKSKAKTKATSKNLRYNLYITLEDVNKGCDRTIRYIRKNKNEKETVQLTVKVPKGAFHHQRLKLSQFGDSDGETTGDLFVILHLQNHPIFLKKELDLRVNVPITYLDAALGNTIEIPTLNGIRKQKLKACEFNNIKFQLRGFGLPDSRKDYKGDLHVHCFIEHPKRLSSDEKNAMQKALKTWPTGEMMQQYQSYLNQLKRS